MQQEIETAIREFLQRLGAAFSDVTHETLSGQSVFTIRAEDGRALIGPHGDTLFSIDMLVKKMIEKKHPRQPLGTEASLSDEMPPFLVDVNGYRAQHIKDLDAKARVMADRARELKYDVELEPMSSYERLIVHSVLQNQEHIRTESQGEGRGRRVVIKYVA
jgi:spoIIIJ-associated protein